MPTTIHIPPNLLEAVDKRARALRISRNRLIVRALEREIAGGSDWSEGFLERLADVEPATARDVDEMLEAIKSARTSKKARTL